MPWWPWRQRCWNGLHGRVRPWDNRHPRYACSSMWWTGWPQWHLGRFACPTCLTSILLRKPPHMDWRWNLSWSRRQCVSNNSAPCPTSRGCYGRCTCKKGEEIYGWPSIRWDLEKLISSKSKIQPSGDEIQKHLFNALLVGGLEHGFYFPIQLGMSSSQLTNSYFFRGVETTNKFIMKQQNHRSSGWQDEPLVFIPPHCILTTLWFQDQFDQGIAQSYSERVGGQFRTI